MKIDESRSGNTDPVEFLWEPSAGAWESSTFGEYVAWLAERRLINTRDYNELWRWSIDSPAEFWLSVVDFFDVQLGGQYRQVRSDDPMPETKWFDGATVNYAEHALRAAGQDVAIIARSQTRASSELTYDQLRDQVGRARAGLQRLGVGRGDRVAACLPNIPETAIAFLAASSLGAVWTSCSPEFGVAGILDRFGQVGPKLLLTIDGYLHRERPVERRVQNAQIAAALPSVEHVVEVSHLGSGAPSGADISWSQFTSSAGEFCFDQVPFDHPLYVLFSSGTTGPPKAIVHGHGGILLEHLKLYGLHREMRPGDVMLTPATTAWMVWNSMMSSLLTGATVVMFDGDVMFPDRNELWRVAADVGATHVGSSAALISLCSNAGDEPGLMYDLSRLRRLVSTGSPLDSRGFVWVYKSIGRHVQLESASGGTDVCTAFVGTSPVHPVVSGEISCRLLGVAVDAFDESGHSVRDQRAELVITSPMPSMPVCFWGDEDGSRYRRSYFERYPGVWHHGDWITITQRETCTVSGRSDATLNRGGVRLGTGEFYEVIDAVPGVEDSVVVHLDAASTGPLGRLVTLIALADGAEEEATIAAVCSGLRARSPRHVPDVVHVVEALPRTITGKKLEVPLKRILQGERPDQVLALGGITNPDSIRAIEGLAIVDGSATTPPRRV